MVIADEHRPEDVVIPRPEDAEGLAKVLDFVRAERERPSTTPARLLLTGPDGHDRVELTEDLLEVLRRAAEALVRGQSISVLTRDQEISTQQAADLLGLSRPTVVKLIDDGELEARVPGAERRKLRLADVLTYKAELHSRRTKFIAATSEGRSDDVDDLVRQARRAR